MINKVNAWCVSKWNGNDYVYCGVVKGERSEDSLGTVGARYGSGKFILNPHIDNATVDGGGRYEIRDCLSDIYPSNKDDSTCPECGDSGDCNKRFSQVEPYL